MDVLVQTFFCWVSFSTNTNIITVKLLGQGHRPEALPGRRYRPDILVRMQTSDLKKKYTFIVEIERKKYPARTYKEKILRIEKIFAKLNFKKYGLSEQTKVLIVWNNLSFNPYWRPLEYKEPLIAENKRVLQKQFDNLLSHCQKLPAHRYRFMPFSEFDKLHMPVWHMPDKKKAPLINNYLID